MFLTIVSPFALMSQSSPSKQPYSEGRRMISVIVRSPVVLEDIILDRMAPYTMFNGNFHWSNGGDVPARKVAEGQVRFRSPTGMRSVSRGLQGSYPGVLCGVA